MSTEIKEGRVGRPRTRDSRDPDVQAKVDAALSAVEGLFAARLKERQREAMRAALEAGATWEEIGAAMGSRRTTAQSWWRRHGDR